MNKGDIKATIILFTYILVGIISGYYLEQNSQSKDGVDAIFGFVFGVSGLGLLQLAWHIIRLDIED